MIETVYNGYSDPERLKSALNVSERLSNEKTTAMSVVCNTVSLMNEYLDNINWVGLYFLRDGVLYLGPFQGKPACMKIEVGNGVCGETIERKEPLVVPDVDQFPGHIACDSRSRSEITCPVFHEGKIIGLIDIDSPVLSRFGENMVKPLQDIAEFLAPYLNEII